MGHVLATLGKRFCLCNVSGVPSHLSWVPLPGQVYTSFEELPFQPRLAIVLDCADGFEQLFKQTEIHSIQEIIDGTV